MNHGPVPRPCRIDGGVGMPYAVNRMWEVKDFLVCEVTFIVRIIANGVDARKILCVVDVVVAKEFLHFNMRNSIQVNHGVIYLLRFDSWRNSCLKHICKAEYLRNRLRLSYRRGAKTQSARGFASQRLSDLIDYQSDIHTCKYI